MEANDSEGAKSRTKELPTPRGRHGWRGDLRKAQKRQKRAAEQVRCHGCSLGVTSDMSRASCSLATVPRFHFQDHSQVRRGIPVDHNHVLSLRDTLPKTYARLFSQSMRLCRCASITIECIAQAQRQIRKKKGGQLQSTLQEVF